MASSESTDIIDTSMLDEELTSHDDNVDWITVRQLVFSRLSFLFSPERIQKAMESTRKPNSNDWIRAAATKIASEWQQLFESPPSNEFPLVALPEDLLKRIFNKFCSTRDMMTLGLVSQQFRRCVNWNKHYLTDCSSRRARDYTLNGSRIPVEKWPHLVELLLDKTVIVSFVVKAPSPSSNTFWIINDIVREKCIPRPDRFQLESVAIFNQCSQYFFNQMDNKGLCSNLRFLNISDTCLKFTGILFTTVTSNEETERLSNVVKEKQLESIELNLRKKEMSKNNPLVNVNIAKICAQIQPHTLRIFKTDSPEHSLLEFVRNVPSDKISCLKTLSYIGQKAIVNYTETKEMIELLWQAAPYLEFCKFSIQYLKSNGASYHYATSLEVASMIRNIFECIRSRSKTSESQQINIVLCAKLEKSMLTTGIGNSYYPLTFFPCKKDKILSILQESDPETQLFEDERIEENVFDKEFVGTYTIRRGRISVTFERTRCSSNCSICPSDYRLVLRMAFERLDLAQRQSGVSKKLTAWKLNRCKADRLIGDLRKKFAGVKLELLSRKRPANSKKAYVGQYYSISVGDGVIMIECSRCNSVECNVCHS